MTTPTYPALLRLPTVGLAFAATAVARVHYGAVSLSLLLAVRDRTGSFAAAGLAVGAFAAAAVSMPLKSRAVDRWGQRRTLPALALGYGVVLLAVALAPLGAVGALVAGLLAPPVGPSMRARWSAVTTGPARGRAYALDTAAEEALYVASPAAAGLLAAWSPTGGLVVVAVLGALGTTALGLAPGSPPASGGAPAGAAWRWPPRIGPGLLVAVGFGAGTAVLEFAAAARLTARGDDALTGIVLGAIAAGSVVGGLLWGRRTHRRPTSVHVAGLLGWIALGAVVAATVDGTAALAVVLAATGLAVSPLLVVVYLAVDTTTSPARRTEATTWVATASNAGSAAGAAGGGALVGLTGVQALVALAVVPLLLGALAAPWTGRADAGR